MRRAAALLALVLALAALPALASAQVNLPDVEDEVFCPVCGTPLNQAEGPQAERQRALIRRLIAQNLTKDEIKDRLVAEYGDEVLAEPQGKGFDLASYAVPIAAVLLALAALAVAVPRWRRRGEHPAAEDEEPAPSLDPTDARRLDDDLARFDG